MQIPKVDKIVINMGVGEAVQNSKAIDSAVGDLMKITGQKPIVTKAKKSIRHSNFVKECLLDAKSPCVVNGCMNLWIAF